MTEIDIAGLRARIQAVQKREKDVPKVYRITTIQMEMVTVLALCDALEEQAREIERLQTAITQMEQATVRMAWQTGEFKARARTAERLLDEKDREIERLRAELAIALKDGVLSFETRRSVGAALSGASTAGKECPDHDCGYVLRPDTGYCRFHEEWAAQSTAEEAQS